MSITQQQYTDVVYRASRANAILTQTLRGQEALGRYPDWSIACCRSLKIKAGKWSLSIQDYTSEVSVDIYNQLLTIGASWTGGIAIDPNAQIPGQIIIVEQSGSVVTSEPILFNNQTTVTLANYQVNYASVFGQYPIIQIYVSDGAGGFNLDNGTSPSLTYVIPNDPTSGLVSVTWGYAVPTSGYILISGYVT